MENKLSNSQEMDLKIKIRDLIKIPFDEVYDNETQFEIYLNDQNVGHISYFKNSQQEIDFGDINIDWQKVYILNEDHLRMCILVYFHEQPYEIVVADEFRFLWLSFTKKSKPQKIRFDYDYSWKIVEVE